MVDGVLGRSRRSNEAGGWQVPAAYVNAAKEAGVPFMANSAGMTVDGQRVIGVESLNEAIVGAQRRAAELLAPIVGSDIQVAAETL